MAAMEGSSAAASLVGGNAERLFVSTALCARARVVAVVDEADVVVAVHPWSADESDDGSGAGWEPAGGGSAVGETLDSFGTVVDELDILDDADEVVDANELGGKVVDVDADVVVGCATGDVVTDVKMEISDSTTVVELRVTVVRVVIVCSASMIQETAPVP